MLQCLCGAVVAASLSLTQEIVGSNMTILLIKKKEIVTEFAESFDLIREVALRGGFLMSTIVERREKTNGGIYFYFFRVFLTFKRKY